MRRATVAAAILLAFAGCGGGEEGSSDKQPAARTPGPLVVEEGNRYASTTPTGREFMYGVPVVFNDGDAPAVLERATFVGATPGLEIVRTLVAGPEREANLIAGSRKFPPTFSKLTDTHPLAGYRVAPRIDRAGERGVELVFVLRARRPGRYVTRGVQLDYRVGDSRHRRVYPNGYAACAFGPDVDLLEADCEAPPPALGEL